MNAKTLKALNGSIAKWEGIRDGKVTDYGHLNCPLCQLFMKDRPWCSGCPVAEATGKSMCHGTPYDDWSHTFGQTADTPELKRLATAELNFLKSLLPKKGKKG